MSLEQSDFTPMMTQYLQIKREYPDAILFFRLGDFYEMFFDDAKTASQALGLTLTAREAGKNNRVPMCGVPYHAADNYINRLIQQSFKVAICEQLEDPKAAKGIVKRDIVRVITPGTLVGPQALQQPQNNYLACVHAQPPDAFGLAVVDLSTGEFRVTELSSEDKLWSELSRWQPSEVVLGQAAALNSWGEQVKKRTRALISATEDWMFHPATAQETLLQHFKTANLRGFGCEHMSAGISAAGAGLRYLQRTQKTDLAHINRLSPYSLQSFMVVDSIALRNLELLRTLQGDKKHTLLDVLNHTVTAMGSRLLVRWIQQPLLDIVEIDRRLDGVEELVGQQSRRRQLQEQLKQINDIERLMSRISLGVAGARDILSLNQSLQQIPLLKKILKEAQADILRTVQEGLDDLPALRGRIDRALRPDAPLSVREGGMFKAGYHAELDGLLDIATGGRQWIAAEQEKEIERTKISSLKIKYNRVFGYYIEITKANLHLVPVDYIRKQTLVNAERFITPALKEQEEKILNAQERIVELEYQLFQELRVQVLEQLIVIQANALHIAALDTLNSLAEAAGRNNYARPTLNDGNRIFIKDGRHPVIETLLGQAKFIPNNTELSPDGCQVAIITGPNMAGKSTYIRQVALIVLMAQMGSFVPAVAAEIGIVDRIFTRVGASDDISAGMSTFMLEMSETANILHNASSRSLIILDEIGRGTSTFDGLSIAWATAEYLHGDSGPRPKTLFATHYHELAEMELVHKGIKNFNVAVREWNDEVMFLYKLVEGAADHSYGIHVARLAGLPREVITRAREILSNLEINSLSREGIPSLVRSDATLEKRPQPELFQQEENPVLAEIRSLDITRLSPLEALNRLNIWKQKLQKKPADEQSREET